VLVASAFLDSDILTFQLRVSVLHNKVDGYPSSQMADQIERTLKQKYRSLLSQGLWTLAECKQKDIEAEVAGLKAVINKLFQSNQSSGKCGHSHNGG
jgi:hypothetical protein